MKQILVYFVLFLFICSCKITETENISEEVKQISEEVHQIYTPDIGKLNGKIYGIVNLSVCNMHSKADHSSEMSTQAILGMPVHILDYDNWYRIQTPDNYIAWVHRAGIHPMTEEEYNLWNQSEKVVVTRHYGFTYEQPNTNSQTVSDVVAGNRFRLEAEEEAFYKVIYPDGRKAYLPKTLSKKEKEWRTTLKQDAGKYS